MSFIAYNRIYTDESHNQKGAPKDSFGALIGSQRRCEIVSEEIQKVRKTYKYDGEIKWVKLKNHNIEMYRAFADVFLKDKYLKLRIMQCNYNQNYKDWEKGKKKFAKTYWLFLKLITNRYEKYTIYCDYLSDISPATWNSMSYLLNKRESYYKGKIVQSIKPVDSINYDLVQLVDLLLGAYCSNNVQNKIKKEFQNYITQKLDCIHGSKKFECIKAKIPNY